MIVVNTRIKDTRDSSDIFCSHRNLRGGRFDNNSSNSSIISINNNKYKDRDKNITELNTQIALILSSWYQISVTRSKLLFTDRRIIGKISFVYSNINNNINNNIKNNLLRLILSLKMALTHQK